jgi:flagellar biosynthesis protein FlhA
VIATATGIIVTRAASDARLGAEVSRQVLAHPRTIAILAFTLLALASLPGIPVWPVAILLPLTVAVYWFARRRAALIAPASSKSTATPSDSGSEDLYKALKVDPVEVVLGSGLIPVVGEEGAALAERLAIIRKQYALDMGVVLPPVRVRDDKRLAPDHYEVRIFGTRVGDGVVHAERLLAINPGNAQGEIAGVTARDPAYGLPAVWVTEDQRAGARAQGFTVVDAATVFMTHVTELLKQNAHNLITRAEAERLVARVRDAQASLVDDLIPKVLSFGDIQRVLQGLIRERVPIRNIDAILEVLADHGAKLKEPEALTELVRERLGPLICQQLADAKGELAVITFDPAVEQALAGAVRAIDDRPTLILEPRYAEQVLRKLSEEVERLARGNTRPVLLCPPSLRRHVRRFTERLVPQLSVLSLNEVPTQMSLRSAAVVRL